MIKFHELLISEYTVEKRLYDNVIKLANLLGYEIAKLIEINRNNYMAIIRREYAKGGIGHLGNLKNNSIFLKNNDNHILKLFFDKKQMIAYFGDENSEMEHMPLIEGIKSELYIPLLLDESTYDVIIGCVYLASFNDKRFANFEHILNDEVKETIEVISNLCQTLHSRSKWIDVKSGILHLTSEITRIREPFMVNHPYKVAQWSRLLGKEMSLDQNRLYKLDTASIMHDIGKLYIDADILNKTSKLTEEEFMQIKQHPINSCLIVRDVFCFEDELKDVCQIVKYHHERYDGKGYPEGLKEEEIPLESRILCVADSVDAMMSSRSYKSPKSLDKTITELIVEKGKQFDPIIADKMVQILLKTKITQEKIIDSPIVWGTLTINSKDKSYLVEGTLEQRKFGYVFNSHSFSFSDNIEVSKITNISLYVEKNRNITEFDVKIQGINNNNMYISELIISPITDSFSMLWNIRGLLYEKDENQEINIYKIGGSSLAFYIHDKKLELHAKRTILKLAIYFDEETEIIVTGKIAKSVSVSKKNYYEFIYINTPNNIKDKIFSKLFRKQIELMKLNTVQEF